MKEITRVHLAKTPYDIEVDAKKALEKYLSAIEKAMSEDDVMVEIEARMVELLAERGVASGGVIALADVQALRQQMGEPKEFSEDGEVAEEAAPDQDQRAPKRLMRDPDNAMLGGVCSGLAAYFGIDVVWARIAAIVLLIASFGTAVLAYILLCIVMPEAKTAADKLQMRGEPVTLENLRNFSSGEGTSQNLASKSSNAATFKKVLGALAGIILLFIMLGGVLALVVGGWLGWTLVGWLSGFAAQPYVLGALISLIVAGMAFVMFVGLLANMCFTQRIRRAVAIATVISLMIGTIATSIAGVFMAQSAAAFNQDEQRLTKVVKLDLPDMDEVRMVAVDDDISAVNYESNEPVRAELRYLDLGGAQPKVEFDRRGETLHIKVVQDDDEKCRDAGTWHWILGRNDNSLCSALSRAQIRLYGSIGQNQSEYNVFEVRARE